MTSALEELTRNGVSIWLDDMSRERLTGGDLQDLVDHRQVSGVTANPSIFASALKNGRAYDDQIGDLAAWRVSTDAMIRHVMAYDIRGACDNGVDALFVTGGIHAADFGPSAAAPDPERVVARLRAEGMEVAAFMPALSWSGGRW